MKFEAAKTKKWLFGLSSCLVVAFALMPAATASADTYPYLKEYGGDVSAGGWFNGGVSGGCAGNNSYQYPGYGGGGSPSNLTGGILTHANITGGIGGGGSSSQYGAFALGNIDTNSAGTNSGFYSGGSQASSAVDRLSFANISLLPNSSGGDFGGGGQPPDQCIPDYYDDAQQGTPTAVTGPLNLSGVGSGQYTLTGCSAYCQLGGNVGSGQNVGVFVDGNVYINSNIIYGSKNNINSPTKFALVVRGNIYIDPTVTELDGWYIAQPTTTGTPATNDGVIWTCRNDTSGSTSIDSTFILNNCGSQLVINGALTAKHVNFTRINGNVVNAVSNSTTDGSSNSDSNAAEIINFTPDMVLGGPFFDLPPSTPKVEQLISLPPVF